MKTSKKMLSILLFVLVVFGMFSVTLTANAATAVTSVKLNRTSGSLYVGKTYTLTPTIAPSNATNKNVTWSSNKTAVATVDSSGKVTAKGVGSCYIYCKAADGSGKYARFTLTVKEPIDVTKITLNSTSKTIYIGKTTTLAATVYPSNATYKTVNWGSNNTAVATVDSSGKVTAKGVGSCYIYCKATDGSGVYARCKITVKPILATGIKLNATSKTVYAGYTTTLTATVSPTNTTDKTVTWTSSNTSIATVSSKGVVKGVKAGTCYIYGKTSDGTGLSASCKITVKTPVKVSGIKLNVSNKSLYTGYSTTLKATISPSNAYDKKLVWTSNNTPVATVDENGKVKAIKAGTATITCKAADGSGKYVTCKITVIKKIPIEKLELSANLKNLVVGGSYTIVPKFTPEDASITKVKWTSSNSKIVSVSEKGVVKGLKIGEAKITCETTDGSKLKETTRVVVHQPVTKIALSKTSLTLDVNKTANLTYTLTPDSAYNKNVKWSSTNTKVVTVAQDGTIKAVGKGSAYVRCTSQDGAGKYGQCKVTVKAPVLVSKISFSATSYNYYVGYNKKFTPTITPSTATNKTLKWTSSNKAVATVASNGTVTTLKQGTTVITCTAADGSGTKASYTLNVLNRLVQKIKFTKETYNCKVGYIGSLAKYVTVSPSNATFPEVTWNSSNPDIVSVDTKGYITAKANGTVTITCSSTDGSGVKGTCYVKSSNVPVTGITLSSTSQTIYMGKTLTITPTIAPTNATNKNVTWTSSDITVATVSSRGVVLPIKEGSVIITCVAVDGSGVSAKCKVTIKDVGVSSIVLSSTTLNLLLNKTSTLKATVLPEDTTNKIVNWETSNPNVATVNASGTVKAVGVGTAKIICSSSEDEKVKAECVVKVTTIPVEEITLSSSSINLYLNKYTTLSAAVFPENAINKAVNWSSSNTSVATVSDFGKITAKSEGTAIITCSAKDGSGVTATCKVTVAAKKVNSITLSEKNTTLYINNYLTLKATVSPSDATNDDVTWSSSNTEVATVSTGGKIKGLSKGVAIITCEATDGSGVSATCKITVTNKDVESITLSDDNITLYVNKYKTIKATILPSDATNENIIWESSNPSVVSVTSSGKVTVIGYGSSIITCYSESNPEISASCIVSSGTYVESITIESDKDSFFVGDSTSLKATINPDNATNNEVSWKSSSTSVATVTTDGIVNCLKAGTVTITCSAKDGSNVKGTFKITIYNPTDITQLYFDGIENETTLVIGEGGKINVGKYPANATSIPTFSSSNSSILAIDENGNFLARKIGTVTVTAESGPYTAEIEIKVIASSLSIETDSDLKNLTVGDEITVYIKADPDKLLRFHLFTFGFYRSGSGVEIIETYYDETVNAVVAKLAFTKAVSNKLRAETCDGTTKSEWVSFVVTE